MRVRFRLGTLLGAMLLLMMAGVIVWSLFRPRDMEDTRRAVHDVMAAFRQARDLAAESRQVYFLVFHPGQAPQGVTLHRDTNGNRVFDGSNTDRQVVTPTVEAARSIVVEHAPLWLGFHPAGYSFPFFADQDCSTSPGRTSDIRLRCRGSEYRVDLTINEHRADVSHGSVVRP